MQGCIISSMLNLNWVLTCPLNLPRLASVCTRRVFGLEIRPDCFLCSLTNLELPGFSIHTAVVRELGLFTVHALGLYHFLWYVNFLLESILGHNTNLIGFIQLHKKAGLQGSCSFLLIVLFTSSLAGFWLLCLWSGLVKATHHWASAHSKAIVCIYTERIWGQCGSSVPLTISLSYTHCWIFKIHDITLHSWL